MTTGARGDVSIQDGDHEVRLLYTNRALGNTERALGKSVIAVAQVFGTGGCGIYDVAQLLLAGMEAARQEARATGRAHTLGDAYAVMDRVGFSKAANAVMEGIAMVLSYGTETPDEEGGGEDPK
jgi:hypothetical protein